MSDTIWEGAYNSLYGVGHINDIIEDGLERISSDRIVLGTTKHVQPLITNNVPTFDRDFGGWVFRQPDHEAGVGSPEKQYIWVAHSVAIEYVRDTDAVALGMGGYIEEYLSVFHKTLERLKEMALGSDGEKA